MSLLSKRLAGVQPSQRQRDGEAREERRVGFIERER